MGVVTFYMKSTNHTDSVNIEQYNENISMANTKKVYDVKNDFNQNRIQPTVLKFIPGTQNLVRVIDNYDNGDAEDFEENSLVLFDGKMHLKTHFQQILNAVEIETGFKKFTMSINYKPSDFKVYGGVMI